MRRSPMPYEESQPAAEPAPPAVAAHPILTRASAARAAHGFADHADDGDGVSHESPLSRNPRLARHRMTSLRLVRPKKRNFRS